MKNFEEYENAMKSDSSYSASLSKSMALVLEEFYENLHNVGVSAVTGAGMDEFFEAVALLLLDDVTLFAVVRSEVRRRVRGVLPAGAGKNEKGANRERNPATEGCLPLLPLLSLLPIGPNREDATGRRSPGSWIRISEQYTRKGVTNIIRCTSSAFCNKSPLICLARPLKSSRVGWTV